jgi:hypothetical protein
MKTDKNSLRLHRIDTFKWEGAGFQGFVSHRGWLVALMNWEPRFDPANIGQVERHNKTDEVFVLTHGHAILFVDNDGAIQAIEMEPGLIYNVTAGTWHSVIGHHDTSWLIVESNDTNSGNSDYRSLTERELSILNEQFPNWKLGQAVSTNN